ncbi:hypothetical protein TIFTF001_006469 [Ficus carica]|uniref:Uncharacterized protein n=1 Tax=Ficus carica TaxID=3494 RepID=A0AA87ZPC9_FICCA|nr:hypothetical protein TIFTF001_006469 [Ficus carica]
MPFVERNHVSMVDQWVGLSLENGVREIILMVNLEPIFEALIDGLLWSCHPKLISVPSDSMLEKDCIKVLCEKLLKREHSLCCDSSRIKCWRRHLKDARIERFGEGEY